MTSDSIEKASIHSISSVIIHDSHPKYSLFSCCGCSRKRKSKIVNGTKSNVEKGFLKPSRFFKAQKRQVPNGYLTTPTDSNTSPSSPELVKDLQHSISYLSESNPKFDGLDSYSFANIEVASSVPEQKSFNPNATPKSIVSHHFSSPTTNLSAYSTQSLLQKLHDKTQILDEYYKDTTIKVPIHSSSSNSLLDKSNLTARSYFYRHRSIDSLRRSQQRKRTRHQINENLSSESSRFNLYDDEDNILRELVRFNNDIDLILTRWDMENEDLQQITNQTTSNENMIEENSSIVHNEKEIDQTIRTMRTDTNDLSIHVLLANDIDRVRSTALTKLLQMISDNPNSDLGHFYETITLNKLNKLPKSINWKNKRVFGVPLRIYQQTTGHILPLDIQHAFEYVRMYAGKCDGLFRKPGAKSKIDHLRTKIETNNSTLEFNQFNEYQPFVVADVIRQYFRELPECLIPPIITRLLCDLLKHVNDNEQFLAIRYVFLLLSDETREVLEVLLRFLLDISIRLGNTPTTYRSLARIFLPSIFQSYFNSSSTSTKIFWKKWKKDKSNGIQQENERLLLEQCLMTMISQIDVLCQIPNSLTNELKLSSTKSIKRLNDLVCDECNGEFDLKRYTTKKTEEFLQHLSNRKFKTVQNNLDDDVHMSIHKSTVSLDSSNENSLPIWKCSIEIPNTNVKQVQQRILEEQYIWENHFAESRIIEQIDRDKAILQYVYNFQDLLPVRSFCEFRYSKKVTSAANSDTNSIVISSLSIDHLQNHFLPGTTGLTHDMHYYITPSINHPDHITVTQIASVDYSGRSSQWYENIYGFFLAHNLISLRDTFTKPQVYRV